MEFPRVIYISNGSLGLEIRDRFSHMKQSSVCVITQDALPDWSLLPHYDLGINFLGTHKIPTEQVGDGKVWCNFHPAPLPEFKGRNLAFHAIMNGAKQFGATLHWMDEDYDTGDLIDVRRFDILPQHNAGDLVGKSHQLLKEMFLEWIPKILAGERPGTPQVKGWGNYYQKNSIDEEIYIEPLQKRRVKALTVHPRFYSHIMIDGRKYKLVPEELE